MRHFIRISALGKFPEIDITAEEYLALEVARNILVNALAIEEKYEMVIANYLVFEKTMLDEAVNNMVRMNVGYPQFFDFRLTLNIHLANILSAVRLYLDQISHNVQECLPDNPDANKITQSLRSQEHKEHLEYRFMEALRNHVQHRGLPVHLITLGIKEAHPEGERAIEFSIAIASRRSDLEKDKNFNKSVIKEIGDKIDLKEAVRIYINSISNIHDSVRGLIKESVDNSRELFEYSHRRYEEFYSGNLTGLCAMKLSGEQVVDNVPLLLKWDEIRIELQNRNRKFTNLKNIYVTNIIQSDEEQ